MLMESEVDMRRGINYDIGTNTRGSMSSSRKDFDLSVVQRELEIIRKDLRCDSVRISGQDIVRLVQASEYALEQGLEVWFSPCLRRGDRRGDDGLLQRMCEGRRKTAERIAENRFCGRMRADLLHERSGGR
jgi:hypothetical protein